MLMQGTTVCTKKLIATTLLYLTFYEPIQDITNSLATSSGDSKSLHSRKQIFVSAYNTANNNADDYYETLGITKEATKDEIHKAFRKLAKKYHPDRNKDKGAEEEFIKIFKAYETLSDENKRKEYDDRSNNPYSNFQESNKFNPADFDINEFFKQYESHFAQYYNYHHGHHAEHQQQHYRGHHDEHNTHHLNDQRFMFHGVNFDNLFNSVGEDEFTSFGNLFSNHHHDLNSMQNDNHFGDGASFFGSHFEQNSMHNSNGAGYSCQTVTRHVNGMVMTQTSCS